MGRMTTDTGKIFLKTWQGYAAAFPSSARFVHAALEIAFAGILVPLFNLAFLKNSGQLRQAELERLLGEFGKLLTPRGVPGLLMVRGAQLGEGAGLEPMLRMPGMVARELLPPQWEQGNFTIREVAGTAMAEEIARLNVVAHEMEMKDVAPLTCAELWRGPHHGFLLYEDEAAVAGGAASFVEGVSYIGWMATLREKRGRGYAEGVLRHMEAFMRRRYGVKETVLHATKMGRPIYQRMGFQTVDEFAGYLCVPGNRTEKDPVEND